MECRFSFPQTHPSVMLRFRWRRVIGDIWDNGQHTAAAPFRQRDPAARVNPLGRALERDADYQGGRSSTSARTVRSLSANFGRALIATSGVIVVSARQ